MLHRVVLFSVAMLSVANLDGRALAADMDPPYIGSQQYRPDPVEFGTGWYIRGDMAATKLPSITTTAPGLLNNNQAFTYFNAGGNPQLINEQGAVSSPSVSHGSDVGYTASLGAGYKFTSWFRTDVIADFHQPIGSSYSAGNSTIFCQTGIQTPQILNSNNIAQPLTGSCTGNYAAKLNSYDVLANVYVDIGTWSSVTPYVGAGAGLSFGHYHTSATYVQSNNAPYAPTYTDQGGGTSSPSFDRSSGGTYYNFAWALMAGVGIDVYKHTTLDVGYRYLNLGKISGVSNTLYSHEVKAGVRYQID